MGASGKGGLGPVVAADRGPAADQRHPEESSEHAAYFRTAGSFFLQLPPSLGTISWFHSGFLRRVTCSNRHTILTRPPRRLPRTSGLHRAPTSLASCALCFPLVICASPAFHPESLILVVPTSSLSLFSPFHGAWARNTAHTTHQSPLLRACRRPIPWRLLHPHCTGLLRDPD